MLTSVLEKPPYTEPYVWWCERTGVSHLLLLDFRKKEYATDNLGDSPMLRKKQTGEP
ncbi:hypothetical protein JOC33_003052 [Thalassobacillus pellis]|nr:hypothetical protein [Thalassobacillus pellis]